MNLIQSYDSVLFDSLPDSVVILDADLRIRRINSRAQQLFEVEQEELFGAPLCQLFHQPLSHPQRELIDNLRENNTDWLTTTLLRFQGVTHSGRRFYVNFSTTKFPEENETLILLRDISEFIHDSIQLESAKKRLEEAFVINRIGTWEYLIEEDRMVLSSELLELLGLGQDFEYCSFNDLQHYFHSQDQEFIAKAYSNSIKNRIPYNIIHRINPPNKAISYIRTRGKTYYSENGMAYKTFGTIQDVTDLNQRRLEADHYVRMLENQKSDLENSLYIATHDLKEPINNIMGLTELIKMELTSQDMDSEQLLNYSDTIISTGKRLQSMVESLINLGQIGKNEMMTQVNCEEIVQEVMSTLHFQINSSQAIIEVGKLPVIRGFRMEITLVFQNLLSNAIKYKHPDRVPSIKISAHEEDRFWLFTIEDNGIGVDPRYEDRVLGLFKRVPGNEGVEGTGIGLTQCKKIVEQHQGELWFESEYGHGTVFYFTLRKVGST
ncbi:ATP-binding protein [Algoriphagus sp.]|uniref:sensor histidine kinase n=1 Tax=Algoriphagus sp. TaxID=1872435 RepID=UPI002601CC57|nr:ATP-binding protein [Algoriphagus sp.]